MTSVTLLGPQRTQPTLDVAMAELGLAGPLAVVTSGWEEREAEDEELSEHVGVETRNLRLFGRTEEVFGEDPELYAALLARKDALRALQDVYRRRLDHALAAARELFAADGDAGLLVPERAEALAAVAALDAHHLARVRRVHAEFEERWRPSERPSMARHRAEVAERVDGCAGLAVAGGQVVVLLNRLRLFGIADLVGGRHVLAWSAGAMAVTERVVLFHDHPPQGRGNPEVLEAGLGLAPRVVALPHARRRLELGDPVRVAVFARRFAPAECLALDEDCRARWDGRRWTPGGRVRALRATGEVERMVAS